MWYLLAFLAVGFLLMAGCQHFAYSSKAWQDFLKFNDARTEVYDYTGVPSYEENKEFYDEHEISVQVFEALDIYDLTGRTEITTELLQMVAKYQKEKQILPLQEKIAQTIERCQKSFFADQYGESLFPLNFFMVLLWISFLLFSIIRKNYANIVAGLAVLIIMGAMCFYLAWQGRILYRVMFVMQLLLTLVGAGLWYNTKKGMFFGKLKQRYYLTAIFFLLLIPAFRTWSNCYAYAVEARLQNSDRMILEEYFKEHSEQFYLVTTPLVASVSDDITLHTNRHPMNYTELGGWIVKSPLYEERLRQAGITDIRQMLLNQKGCVITSGRSMSYLFSDTYIEGEEIEYRCLEDLNGEDNKYYIYQYILL